MDLRGVDLNLLLALDALLSEQNVTRAADRLSIGQSAMSASLGRLRKHFDDRLLVREGNVLLPTPTAEALQPLVREAVRNLHTVFDRSGGFDPLVNRRSFTVLASDYVTLVLLRPLMARLADEAPLQRLTVVPVQVDHVDHLRSGEADLLILPAEMVDPRMPFRHRHLFTDRYVLVADRKNPAIGDTVTKEQFSELPYVAFSGGPHPSFADSQLDALEIARHVTVSTQSLVTIPLLVADSPLIALAHERLARLFAGNLDIKIIEPPMTLRPISETMFWATRTSEDLGLSWLRGRIAQAASEMSIDTVASAHR